MFEFTPRQMEILERLVGLGLRPIAVPPYESSLCLHRGHCAVVLAPIDNAGLKVLAPPSVLIDGHFAVRLRRPNGDVFVWKQNELPATETLLAELKIFSDDLHAALETRSII
jgi:hypothetical protein